MTWIVTHDHLDDGSDGIPSRVGVGQWDGDTPPPLDSLPLRCKLYDDDGELYYTIAYDQSADDNDEDWGGLYQAYQWGMSDAGTTDLRVDGKPVYG